MVRVPDPARPYHIALIGVLLSETDEFVISTVIYRMFLQLFLLLRLLLRLPGLPLLHLNPVAATRRRSAPSGRRKRAGA
jgi:hypothetical protein